MNITETTDMAATIDMSPTVALNKLQQHAFDLVVWQRKNILLTAAGGAGKTFLLKHIRDEIAQHHNVGLTSLTGISANLLNGQTLHSYLGIGLGADPYELLLKKVMRWKFMKNRWCRLDILIVDEISMLSIELFEKLEKMARAIRESELPFGGIQLVFSGDFLQLPTVGSDRFCFESLVWAKCISDVVILEEIMRQRDVAFISVLNKIRVGKLDDECYDLIEQRCINYESVDGILPTKLYSTNALVDTVNNKYYSALVGPEYIYDVAYTWRGKSTNGIKKITPPANKEFYESQVKLQYKLKLKKGAQVMHLINVGNLFNGSRGVVIDFVEGFPLVQFVGGTQQIISPCSLDVLDPESGKIVMAYKQLPLKLAFAMSIHKSQGCTVDLLSINFKRIFEYGQFYVALSRCTSLNGLYLSNLDWNLVKTHPRALEFYKGLKSTATM